MKKSLCKVKAENWVTLTKVGLIHWQIPSVVLFVFGSTRYSLYVDT